MDLKIFTTGGTIDKIYFDAESEFQIGDPHMDEVLQEANVVFSYNVESILKKDSLDMTDDDRRFIRERVEKDPCTRILITHGTDSMVETANQLLSIDKTIVLTGSMQPAKLRVSDAFFNIGYAVAAAQILPKGVYIAINGRIFDPRKTTKNRRKFRFES